ncbi:hypothetical protein [Variovorax sp. Varisp36]|uniref:hypothetical protein n=1 Tax=Variovorax sp. Varisp36 TaxID=3243031 RepID=UPI0039A4184F
MEKTLLRNSSLISLSLIFAASLAIAGCASSGRQIEQASVQKIVPGTTTKQQMVGMFGPPLSQSYGTEGKLTMLWLLISMES